jgi:hypothetical protein
MWRTIAESSMWNLIRGLSPRAITETYVPPTRHEYRT